MKYSLSRIGFALVGSLMMSSIHATPIPGVWDGWIPFADGEETNSTNINTYVGPGYGGQLFDAEYLFYKLDIQNNTLSLGLQSGYDLIDGAVTHNGKTYYAGDLALSFDGDSSNYEYGVDFGLYTEDYSGHKADADTDGHMSPGDGTDVAGLYSVSTWNNDVHYKNTISVPFAIDGGSLLKNSDDENLLLTNIAGSGTADEVTSYYRKVTIDLSGLNLSDSYIVDAHWTMSCGNDYITGGFAVEEPSTLFLLGLGLVSLGLVRMRKIKS